MLDRMLLAAGGEEKLYVEDVFSTYLYTGNGSTQTITNGLNVSGQGGLVWVKGRSGATDNALYDTVRGATNDLSSNNLNAQTTQSTGLTAFNSNGFSIGSLGTMNTNAATYASWTFRKAQKFFDVVTYTGDGTSGRTVTHNLGVAPGTIIVKSTTGATSWMVYHRSLGGTQFATLNSTAAAGTGSQFWNNTDPTASVFTLGNSANVNGTGNTYVAYLFAHDAAADGLIQCGSYMGNGSTTGPTVTLGWEPQWLMIRNSSVGGNWQIIDNMRGMPVGSADATLQANLASAETSVEYVSPTVTGFQVTSTNSQVNTSGATYIYIAIRRGPMKTPTVGTSVFAPVANNAGSNPQRVTNFPVDMFIKAYRPGDATNSVVFDRMRGKVQLVTTTTSAEASNTNIWADMDFNTGVSRDTLADTIYWNFRRAPGFMDVVAYTGTGANRTVTHNLGVAPELMIVKCRTAAGDWQIYSAALANTEYMVLNTTAAKATGATRWNSASPTTTAFTVGTDATVNASGATYIAYLFATCPGVSKVGSYTGNGSSQTINCGFSGGARFFLVKRTDSTGNWWVWDSARGIVTNADPALALNSTAVEVTSADAVDTESTGIIVNQETTCNINVNGATYIYLAIA